MSNRSIGAQRALAVRAIDEAAGEARGRHQTLSFGQAVVYAAKLAQAQAYTTAHAVDAGAAVPAYVAAEAAAVGGTALAAAEAIVAAAAAFHAGPGPQIEQARRAGKLAVQAAGDADQIQAAVADALAALQAI
ncbi:MAG: hypothetical protein QE285_14730 [Aquabacterium sp.]|nr:hypothetical protein [Aquabacterium sp.]